MLDIIVDEDFSLMQRIYAGPKNTKDGKLGIDTTEDSRYLLYSQILRMAVNDSYDRIYDETIITEIKNLLSKHSNDTFSFRRQKSPKILNELNARYNIKRINSKEFFYINKKKKNDNSTYQIKSSAPYEQKLNDLLSKTKGRNILSPYQKINTVKSSLEKIINRPKQHLISSESQKYIIKKKLDDYVNEYENFARELNCN